MMKVTRCATLAQKVKIQILVRKVKQIGCGSGLIRLKIKSCLFPLFGRPTEIAVTKKILLKKKIFS
jgi:hypothetical protein